ncbi:hypothetical protein H6P81_005070 [Aristolochia fimbriata]|uniref:Uncharacterized protein n=1 Tax=Aristolochia fimbriata TaxID=158543 RepID=A0AAV7EUL0_ARIFI|nr:hypothetical protein H6P81_005070 [Aristolochia fimbriata]
MFSGGRASECTTRRNGGVDDRLNMNFNLSSLSSSNDFDSIAEAPDIRVWFPSYESPECDISDDFDGFDILEEISRRKERLDEPHKSDQEKRISKEVKEQTRDPINKELSKVEVTEKDVTPVCSSEQLFLGCSSIPPKGKEDLSIPQKLLVENGNIEISTKDPEYSQKLSPLKAEVEEKTGLEERKGSGNGFSSPKENASPKKFIARPDRGEKSTSNGFITVKKKGNPKARSEKLSNRQDKDPLAEPSAGINKVYTSHSYGNSTDGQINNGNLGDLERKKSEGRRGGEHNQATEAAWLGRTELLDQKLPVIGGKWQCPRKKKPYEGPPLKQLRLERWVHRLHG